MINAIETSNLTYKFGNQIVVDNLSLQVPKGSIYGFLGHNGAGKTTTIKILLNLLKSKSNEVKIFGKDINSNRIACLKRIGALVEQPSIYGHLTGYENLKNRAMIVGVNQDRISEMLNLVGLSDAANKKAEKYSLGMKQRLGIAIALLSDPELLLLDEPTNGLDPNGIIEIRNLMIDLVKNHNKTILVSSHLLAEIERTATHVGIINKGKLLFQGTIDELHNLSKPSAFIQCDDSLKAQEIIKNAGFSILKSNSNRIDFNCTSVDDLGKLNTSLIQNGITVYALGTDKKDLENLFLDITSKN
ncbi:ABC transporter ATP-binding protein [Pedobacter flavus]|uniref:ABC transporter ATP-binding protein n=1 Tax=Pedobacter flavus TaxID=3113906 RepID=A0ABU7GYU7_9SPHI|nr:ABC transporter ATP-binding protein [Pedobacter sp. VNH31]MEE1884239.1 ABC transporter ATP-binding protein [Pedobacter sp. VNH31]